MVIKLVVVVLLITIFGSLASAMVFLLRDGGRGQRTVKALTWRIGLSLALFLVLMAGFYFGIIPPQGLGLLPR